MSATEELCHERPGTQSLLSPLSPLPPSPCTHLRTHQLSLMQCPVLCEQPAPLGPLVTHQPRLTAVGAHMPAITGGVFHVKCCSVCQHAALLHHGLLATSLRLEARVELRPSKNAPPISPHWSHPWCCSTTWEGNICSCCTTYSMFSNLLAVAAAWAAALAVQCWPMASMAAHTSDFRVV